MEKIIILECIIAVAIRFWLLESDYNVTLANRVEVATPLNSWKRGKQINFSESSIFFLSFLTVTLIFLKPFFTVLISLGTCFQWLKV